MVLNVTYSPSHRRVRVQTINIQSTLRTAPDLCQNVSLAVLFGRNGNSYTVCTQSDVCENINIFSSQYRDPARAKEIKDKNLTAVNASY